MDTEEREQKAEERIEQLKQTINRLWYCYVRSSARKPTEEVKQVLEDVMIILELLDKSH